MAISTDGGESWSHPSDVPDLIEPVCQASILRYEVGPRWGPLLFANPASHHRTQMTVKLSEDGGLTWPKGRQIYPGPSAYSCLAVLPDGGVACLYERGEKGPYETITLAQFSISWLGSSRL
jgi:sialidase-1